MLKVLVATAALLMGGVSASAEQVSRCYLFGQIIGTWGSLYIAQGTEEQLLHVTRFAALASTECRDTDGVVDAIMRARKVYLNTGVYPKDWDTAMRR